MPTIHINTKRVKLFQEIVWLFAVMERAQWIQAVKDNAPVTKVGPKILKAGVPKMSTNVSQIIHARKIHLSGASIHLEVSGADLVLKDILAMDSFAMTLTNV